MNYNLINDELHIYANVGIVELHDKAYLSEHCRAEMAEFVELNQLYTYLDGPWTHIQIRVEDAEDDFLSHGIGLVVDNQSYQIQSVGLVHLPYEVKSRTEKFSLDIPCKAIPVPKCRKMEMIWDNPREFSKVILHCEAQY